MTAEPRPSPPVPPLQCPRCKATLPPVSLGSQIIRCGTCGAAMEVRVRTAQQAALEGPATSYIPPPAPLEGAARPRRRPMVEVAGPRRAAVEPVATLTVDLPVEPEPEPAPAPTPRPPSPASIDVPWFAEDIERLPDANVDLGQLALESFEALPPLPVRPDLSQASRATGGAPSRPPGGPGSHLQGK